LLALLRLPTIGRSSGVTGRQRLTLFTQQVSNPSLIPS